jgi:hypothetical protein
MTRNKANYLCDILDGSGEIYENYSGRGMYGEETVGVRYCGELIYLLNAILDNPTSYESYLEEKRIDDEGGWNLRWDNLGYDIIIY